MYGETYDTDWDPSEVNPDEAVDRAFALGVASVLGVEPEGERDRLLDLADTPYGRSMLELSYEEGQQEARDLRRDPSVDADDPSAVWAELVAGDGVARRPGDVVRESDLPDALAPADLLRNRPTDDDPSLLDPPEALRRD
ncbi:MAG: hypothetical protein ABEJ34_02220 [Haloferacaceae archaeon]